MVAAKCTALPLDLHQFLSVFQASSGKTYYYIYDELISLILQKKNVCFPFP